MSDEVSKFSISPCLSLTILQCTQKASKLPNLLHSSILPPPVTVKHQVLKFHEMSLSNGQMAMEGKTLRKGQF